MSVNMKVRKQTLSQGSPHWLGSAHGMQSGDTIELDGSLWDFVTNFPVDRDQALIPSGVLVGKVTASGKYGPYSTAVNEVQTISRTSTGGTFALSFDGETSGAIAASAAGLTAAALLAGLVAMSNINPGDVAVAGSAGGPLTITFVGQYAGLNVPAITIDNTNATGGSVSIAQTTAGGAALSNGQEHAAGHLLEDVVVDVGNTTGAIPATLIWHGEVIAANLPTNSGVPSDVNDLKADLPLIHYV